MIEFTLKRMRVGMDVGYNSHEIETGEPLCKQLWTFQIFFAKIVGK